MMIMIHFIHFVPTLIWFLSPKNFLAVSVTTITPGNYMIGIYVNVVDIIMTTL